MLTYHMALPFWVENLLEKENEILILILALALEMENVNYCYFFHLVKQNEMLCLISLEMESVNVFWALVSVLYEEIWICDVSMMILETLILNVCDLLMNVMISLGI